MCPGKWLRITCRPVAVKYVGEPVIKAVNQAPVVKRLVRTITKVRR